MDRIAETIDSIFDTFGVVGYLILGLCCILAVFMSPILFIGWACDYFVNKRVGG